MRDLEIIISADTRNIGLMLDVAYIPDDDGVDPSNDAEWIVIEENCSPGEVCRDFAQYCVSRSFKCRSRQAACRPDPILLCEHPHTHINSSDRHSWTDPVEYPS